MKFLWGSFPGIGLAHALEIEIRRKNWMGFPKIGLFQTLENWNFGKISGRVFQDLPIGFTAIYTYVYLRFFEHKKELVFEKLGAIVEQVKWVCLALALIYFLLIIKVGYDLCCSSTSSGSYRSGRSTTLV